MRNKNRFHSKEPLTDPRGLGFCMGGAMHGGWRQRHLAGVSWNPDRNILIAFNADGLAMPVDHDPDEVYRLQASAVRRELGAAYGDGCHGITASRYRFAFHPFKSEEWATYWFADPEGGFNDKQALELKIKKEIAEETEGYELETVKLCPYKKLIITGLTCPHEQQNAIDRKIAEIKQSITDSNTAEYRRQLKYERDLEAWLRGNHTNLRPPEKMQAA